jgi:hypothetical protein
MFTISKNGSYVSSKTWDFLREKKEKVDWWKMEWFPYAIPKHAFIVWLAVQDRLIIGARMVKWGYKREVKCFFFFFVTIKLKARSISSLSAVLVTEFGTFVC